MKKVNAPLVIIIIIFFLTVANVITAEKNDEGFWLGITSSVLSIIAMLFLIRQRNKQNKIDSD